MRAFLAALVVAAAGLVVHSAPTAAAAAAPPASPGCSTAVGPAPLLSGVSTTLTGTPDTSPFGVAAVGSHAYVGETSPSLVVYNLAAGAPRVAAIDSSVKNSLIGLALSRDGRTLVAAEGNGALVFDVAGPLATAPKLTETLVSSGTGAIEAAVSPDGHYAFVSMEDDRELAVFKLTQSRPVGYVPLGNLPVGIAVAPSGRYLYVTSESARNIPASDQQGTLTTINLATAERQPSRAVVSVVPAGCNPVRVVATSSTVFVTARASDDVLAFVAAALVGRQPTAALEGTVRVGEAPVGLAVVRGGRALVVADSNRFGESGATSSLAVVTVAPGPRPTMALAGYLRAGVFPRDMAVSSDGRQVLVTNYGSNQLETVQVAGLP